VNPDPRLPLPVRASRPPGSPARRSRSISRSGLSTSSPRHPGRDRQGGVRSGTGSGSLMHAIAGSYRSRRGELCRRLRADADRDRRRRRRVRRAAPLPLRPVAGAARPDNRRAAGGAGADQGQRRPQPASRSMATGTSCAPTTAGALLPTRTPRVLAERPRLRVLPAAPSVRHWCPAPGRGFSPVGSRPRQLPRLPRFRR
jgi:hypothetical protein